MDPLTATGPAARPRLFRGWIVVGGAFMTMFISFGIAYSFGAFFHSLQQEFDATRGDTSLIFSLSGFLYFLLGIVSGPLADRLGARWVVAFGMLVIAAGLLLASQAQSLWQLYATYGVAVGLGIGFAYVPAVGAVQPWFLRKRGFASGLAVAGIGAGTLAIPPFAALLIDWVDWRQAYVVLALIAGIAGAGFALLLDQNPERHGLLPDGDPATAARGSGTAAPRSAPRTGLTLREALGTRPFWLLYLAAVAASFTLFMPFVHLAPYAQDHGLTERTGAMLLSLIGVGSIIGRSALGGAADRLGRRRALVVMYAGIGVMMLWWLASSTVWALAVFAVLFGIFYGGFVALMPALTADYFSGRSVISIIGALYTSVAVGTLAGPTLAGVAYDLSHSYTLPILVGAASNVIAVIGVLLLEDPARWRGRMAVAAA